MSGKTCQETVALLADYLEGKLSPADRAGLDEHFVTCPRCVRFLRSYQETPRLVRDTTAASLPEEVRDRLQRFLAEKQRK
jgi:anti-sigma factor RsiW